MKLRAVDGKLLLDLGKQGVYASYTQRTGLDKTLPAAPLVGSNLKLHLNSALLAFSLRRQHDLLRKTVLFRHDAFPHSSVQPLGWLDGEILASQLPRGVPRFLSNALGTLIAGRDPARSVVDTHGRVHGMQCLYVADGSVLARYGRVNPALTIYAWGLRLGRYLAERSSGRTR